jgi:hypothetical protein
MSRLQKDEGERMKDEEANPFFFILAPSSLP